MLDLNGNLSINSEVTSMLQSVTDDEVEPYTPYPGEIREGIEHVFKALPNHKPWVVHDFIRSSELRLLLYICSELKEYETDAGRLCYAAIHITGKDLSIIGWAVLRTYLTDEYTIDASDQQLQKHIDYFRDLILTARFK